MGYRPPLPRFRPRDVVFLTFIHQMLWGTLRIFEIMEKVEGKNWGPGHFIAALGNFPSWPLFAKYDGEFLGSPAGPLCNSLLAALLFISLATAFRAVILGESASETRDDRRIPRDNRPTPSEVTTPTPRPTRPESYRAGPDPRVEPALTVVMLSLLTVVGLIALGARNQCFAAVDPLTTMLMRFVSAITERPPLESQIESCRFYLAYGEPLLFPFIAAFTVPYGWMVLRVAIASGKNPVSAGLTYFGIVAAVLIGAFAGREYVLSPAPASVESLPAELDCNHVVDRATFTYEEAHAVLGGGLDQQLLRAGAGHPSIRSLLYREARSATGLEPARRVLWGCVLRAVRELGLRSEALVADAELLFTNADLRDEAARTLAVLGPPPERADHYLGLLAGSDPAVRAAAATVVTGYGESILPRVLQIISTMPFTDDERRAFLSGFRLRGRVPIAFVSSRLGSDSEPIASAAAILFGGFEDDREAAIRTLLGALRSERRPTVAREIVRTLARYADVPADPHTVIGALEAIDPASEIDFIDSVVVKRSPLPPPEVERALAHYADARKAFRPVVNAVIYEPRTINGCDALDSMLAPPRNLRADGVPPRARWDAYQRLFDAQGTASEPVVRSALGSDDTRYRGFVLEFLWNTSNDRSRYESELERLTKSSPIAEALAAAAVLSRIRGDFDAAARVIGTRRNELLSCSTTRRFPELLGRSGPPGAKFLVESLEPDGGALWVQSCERARALSEFSEIGADLSQSLFDRLRTMQPGKGCLFSALVAAIGRSSPPPDGAIEYLSSLVSGPRFGRCKNAPWALDTLKALASLRANGDAQRAVIDGLHSLDSGPMWVLKDSLRAHSDPEAVRLVSEIERYDREEQERTFRPTKALDEKSDKSPTCPDKAGNWVLTKGSGPIWYQVGQGDLMRVRETLPGVKGSLDVPGYRCETLLISAIRTRNEAMVGMLLDAGADPNHALPDGTTPLMMAVIFESPGMTRALLEKGASVNAINLHEETALVLALHRQYKSRDAIVPLLLEHRADPNLGRDRFTYEQPMVLAWITGGMPLVETLHARGGRLDHRDYNGNTILHLAAASPRATFERLVELGSDPSAVNCQGETAQHRTGNR